jgi:hypothetical protein
MKVLIVGHLPNRGKFETGQVLSVRGICRALKSTDYKNPPFIEVGYATMDSRKFLSKPRDADIR